MPYTFYAIEGLIGMFEIRGAVNDNEFIGFDILTEDPFLGFLLY